MDEHICMEWMIKLGIKFKQKILLHRYRENEMTLDPNVEAETGNFKVFFKQLTSLKNFTNQFSFIKLHACNVDFVLNSFENL
jgi:hypothetical protein